MTILKQKFYYCGRWYIKLFNRQFNKSNTQIILCFVEYSIYTHDFLFCYFHFTTNLRVVLVYKRGNSVFSRMENFSGQLKKYKVTIKDLLEENQKLEASNDFPCFVMRIFEKVIFHEAARFI